MIYVHTNPTTGLSRAVSSGSDEGRDPDIYRKAESRWDWKSYERVVEVAAKLNTDAEAVGALTEQGHVSVYLPVDHGDHTSPRFDIIEAPDLGAYASKSFNGDSYPIGPIVKIGKNYSRIYVARESNPDDILVFYRKKQRASWILSGGTWGLIQGKRNERNPSF